jgi:hypothetical protein
MARVPARPLVVAPERTGVWLTGADWREGCRDVASARGFLAGMKERGVDTVFLELKDPQGRPLFPTGAGKPSGPLAHARAAATELQVRLVGVYPVTVGKPGSGEELVEYRWDGETGMARLTARPLDDGTPPRRSPAAASVRREETERMRALGSQGLDAVCITHLGFGGLAADFSPAAREGIQGLWGVSIKSWPDDVATFVPAGPGARPDPVRGPLWPSWIQWRAIVLRQFAFDLEAALRQGAAEAGSPMPRFFLMTDPYYPLHDREGLNWAHPAGNFAAAYPAAPQTYGTTAVGALFQGYVFLAGVPVASVGEASAQGLSWWSSMEGSLRLTDGLVEGRTTTRWWAVSPYAFAGADGELSPGERDRLVRMAEAVRRNGRPLVLLDGGALDEWDLWELAE